MPVVEVPDKDRIQPTLNIWQLRVFQFSEEALGITFPARRWRGEMLEHQSLECGHWKQHHHRGAQYGISSQCRVQQRKERSQRNDWSFDAGKKAKSFPGFFGKRGSLLREFPTYNGMVLGVQQQTNLNSSLAQ